MSRSRLLALVMATVVGMTVAGAAPAAAQDEPVCIGGDPGYWQDTAHKWPDFKVPPKYTRPGHSQITIRPWVKFDSVFRYRDPRHDEGRIFPGKTLRQVLNQSGGGLNALARQAIAALLNSGARADNFFVSSPGAVIYGFQVHWDGIWGVPAWKSRRQQTARYREENAAACPVVTE